MKCASVYYIEFILLFLYIQSEREWGRELLLFGRPTTPPLSLQDNPLAYTIVYYYTHTTRLPNGKSECDLIKKKKIRKRNTFRPVATLHRAPPTIYTSIQRRVWLRMMKTNGLLLLLLFSYPVINRARVNSMHKKKKISKKIT